MAGDATPRELFIVDNSATGWTGRRYLEEWCGLARQFDIATGYFDISALLDLDGEWQKVEKIRILMGAATGGPFKGKIFEIVWNTVHDKLDESIEQRKEHNPLLHGVPAILEALGSRQIECRIYDKAKFHAKAYIAEAAQEIVGDRVLVGSSNFTRPGLTKNIELNVQIQSGRDVAALRKWFEAHWSQAREVTEDVIKTISRHTMLYSPFDVYGKALHEFFRDREPSASEWEEKQSRMFGSLDRYQKEAYWALMKIARKHGGAFLCDGVGLGKTFVGLMLIERLILHEGKRVALFAPKAAREGVWEPHLGEWLPHIGGIGGGTDFSNLAVFNHTDLGRGGDFPARSERIAELADVVVVDEAHHFRNRGKRGDAERGVEPSRYYRMYDILNPAKRPKTVFLLTATPINNRLSDFLHMIQLFGRRADGCRDDAYFAHTVGVKSLKAYFSEMKKELLKVLGKKDADVDTAEHMTEAQEVLAQGRIFRELVVQRSRAYARESQEREHGKATVFPDRQDPKVAEYSIQRTYGRMLGLFKEAFAKKNPLFTLPMYYPRFYYKGEDTSIDPLEEGRQEQVVGLIRTNFLKRFESSVVAFQLSCARLLGKLLAFLDAYSESAGEKRQLKRWKVKNADVLDYLVQMEIEVEDEGDEEIALQEPRDSHEPLKRSNYKIEEMIAETFRDLNQMTQFLNELRKFEPKHDDKLQKLIRLIQSMELTGHKILVFTEFADTARYLKRHLVRAGIEGVEQVDSSTKGSRTEVIERFSPYYNGLSSPQLRKDGCNEIRVLISTDVLSEGLNLQDATRMINYDIHWNPVRLMQRIGRVDRRMDPAVERRLVADHPDAASSRGKVCFWNFLPPEELNQILSLYEKVTQKTLLISKTFGIEGKKLLTPELEFEAIREFNHAYEGTRTPLEEMHLEYQDLLDAHPALKARLDGFPRRVFSGRQRPTRGARGIFFCYALPAFDREKGAFTHAAGAIRWYLYDLDSEKILEEPGEIIASIRSKPDTPRRCTLGEDTLLKIRRRTEKHIKDIYLKSVGAPGGLFAGDDPEGMGGSPQLRCWMELNDG